ncbi:MAG: hypothetical protein IKU43_01305 [Clostridia bacterium]|nr:hypothetical protein [Clostridia bacterium]
MYKYEMHLHSKGTSACGSAESVDYIERAKEVGYAGMVFTNHFIRGNTAIDRDLPWKEFVEFYRQDWLVAKELGDKHGIDVLFGVEDGYGAGKECLIYGLLPEDIAECENFRNMPIAEISAFVRGKGGFIVAAHPFRVRGYIKNPDAEPDMSLFDAIEVYNRGNMPEDNLKAEAFAKKCGCAVISGGDTHSTGGFGFAGISLPEIMGSEKRLVEFLKKGDYTLLYDENKNDFGEKLPSRA